MRRALTIMEVLVTLVVISVLFALTLPAIGNVRRQGQIARATHDVRSVAQIVTAYTIESRDVFPYAGTPGRPWAGVQFSPNPLPRFDYFQMSRLFVNVLDEPTLKRHEQFSRAVAGGGGNRDVFESSVWMSTSTAALPSFWKSQDIFDTNDARSVRSSDVRFASQKALLRHRRTDLYFPSNERVMAGMTDASAGVYEVSPAWRPVRRPYGCDGRTWLTTVDGVNGVDRLNP